MDKIDAPGCLTVIGLGPGDERMITLETHNVLETCRQGERQLLLRTAVHPAVAYLQREGIPYRSFDQVYECSDDFEQVYNTITTEVIDQLLAGKDTVYAVPGHPMLGEKSVELLRKEAIKQGIDMQIIPAVSFLEAMFVAIGHLPPEGIVVHDALSWRQLDFVRGKGNVFMQVYSRYIGSELKLRLMEILADEEEIAVVRAAGTPDVKTEWIPLYRLDTLDWLDHLCSVYVPPQPAALPVSRDLDPVLAGGCTRFARLLTIMDRLRGDDGCPWDREQDHRSLRPYLIEESYEVLQAIDNEDMDELCEELGDVLLQVVFHAQVGMEKGEFDIREVLQTVSEKMVRRHPHVFGDVNVHSVQAVLSRWQQIKAQEKLGKGEDSGKDPDSLLDGIPEHLPALMMAYKIGSRAGRVGFDWDDIGGPWAKLEEELDELRQQLELLGNGGSEDVLDRERVNAELGDLLFAVVNVARFLHINPEMALREANSRFRERFRFIEREADKRGYDLEKMSLAEMDELWDEAKKKSFRSMWR